MEEYNLIIEELKKPTEKVDWKYIEKTLPEIKINTLNPSGENLLFLFSSCKAPILIYSKALDLGINPNQKNSRYGRTCAFYIKDIRVLELLVKYGLNINHLDDSGWTFAHYNINNFDILSFAMNSGLDISIKNKLGRNIMFTLIEDVRQNDFEKYLQILIDFGADINIKGGVKIADIGHLIESEAKKSGFKVIKNLAGHGVGRSLHEEPENILNYRVRTNRERFKKNTTVAIETFISTKSTVAVELKDGWTLVGNKGGYVTQHEQTILITDNTPIILTESNGMWN
ncbi:M24 family metallopeptidase [Cellulophaga lytica]|uniref:M24 family metallopeptidase n=1 Tax=Cellulophaga lytica TaxID=979 RepID=UPI000A6F71A1|nr:M24 family metallopeptidase [Cellulophaga lytica]